MKIRFLFLSLVTLSGSLSPAAEAMKPNVLFIAVDDLNHWIGHLGRNAQTKTPNIDRLAKMGVTFTNAHCAVTRRKTLNTPKENPERVREQGRCGRGSAS